MTEPSIAPQTRRENLALALQEVLTVSARLRSGKQSVDDAAAFRLQVMEALKTANQQSRQQGYDPEDVKLAIFAAVSFVDESVLNLRSPAFADWPRRPLQEELFGHHLAGEVFFQNVQALLARPDSPTVADLLEVYELCLLLGFAGRYSLAGQAELRAIRDSIADKIRRTRGAAEPLSPAGTLPPEPPVTPRPDPLVRQLAFAAAGCFGVAVVLFVVYKVLLGAGVSALAEAGIKAL
jgi:type VI secretion system protein ImpK